MRQWLYVGSWWRQNCFRGGVPVGESPGRLWRCRARCGSFGHANGRSLACGGGLLGWEHGLAGSEGGGGCADGESTVRVDTAAIACGECCTVRCYLSTMGGPSRPVDNVDLRLWCTVLSRWRRKTIARGMCIHRGLAAPLAADRRGCCFPMPPAAPAGPHGWVHRCSA